MAKLLHRRLGVNYLLTLMVGFFTTSGARTVWAGNDSYCIISVEELEIKYLPEAPEMPTQLKLTFRVTHSRTCDGICAPLQPSVEIVLLDCQGIEMPGQSSLHFFTPPCPTATGDTTITAVFGICGARPESYRIDVCDGTSDESCMSQFLCVEGASVPLPSPLNDLECPPAGSDLQEFQDNLICLECRKSGSISAEDLKLYKTKRSGKYTMYTVPECLESCSASSAEPLYGEVINGDFIAPADGFLFAKVEGANSVVDVYVSGSPGEQGWQVPPNARHGQPLDPDSCIDLSGGQSFQFNIRAGRGEPPSFIMITFDWYWWDAGNCCIQHDTKELTIQIEQMRVHLVDPLVPKRARVARSQGEDTELRIPQCSTVDNPGNLTQWFVMWPTTGGQIIQEGHAKGWTIVDDKLFPPGTRETEYEFEE